MGKYTNHNDLAGNAPPDYRDRTTSEAFLKGMSRISPPGMKPRAGRGKKFEQKTDFNTSTRWHHNWDIAMFGGTEIERPTSESKQRTLEMEFGRPR